MTGVEFERIWADKIDKAYSAYLDPMQENNLFKEAIYETALNIYNGLSDEKTYDDISSVIKTNKIFNLNANTIHTSPIPITGISFSGTNVTITTAKPHNIAVGDSITTSAISGIVSVPVINGTFVVTGFVNNEFNFSITSTYTSGTYTANTGSIIDITLNSVKKIVIDYLGLLAMKTKFIQELKLSVTEASNSSPIRIRVDKRTNIKSGELINVSGVVDNTNANGDRYFKKINTYEFDLYLDSDLRSPVSGNGVFSGSAKLNRIYYKSATPYYSSQQIAKYKEPTISFPQFDRAENVLKVLPNDRVCQEITMDYLIIPSVFIDVSNSTVDLENYYSYDFLIGVMDTAKDMFFMRSKDFESLQASMSLENK